MRHTSLLFILCALGCSAATNTAIAQETKRFDAGVTVGVTGLGIDIGWQANDMLRLRAGASWMPHWTHNMSFPMQVGDTPTTATWQPVLNYDGEQVYNDDGTPKMERTDRFGKMAAYMKGLTGIDVDDHVEMKGKPNYWNAKALVDFYPLKDKRWRITGGLFVGNNQIAKAYNFTEEMPSLLAVGIYNNMYYKAVNDLPFINVGGTSIYNSELADRLISYGRMGIHVGDYTHDILDEEGNVLHAKGTPYMMEPDENSMVRAKVLVNSVKPYLGFGYDGALSRDGRLTLGVDAGVMFWGGTPSIVTHDGTDLVNDVENIGGKVQDYVDLIKAFKVLPVVELRLAYKF